MKDRAAYITFREIGGNTPNLTKINWNNLIFSSIFVLLHSCIHWNGLTCHISKLDLPLTHLCKHYVGFQFISTWAPWKTTTGVEVKPRNLTSKITTNAGLQINTEEPIPQGKSPSSSSWPDLVPITEDSPFPLLFVTAVCGNKGKIGSLYKTWQTWGSQSETPIPRRLWVHTHQHMVSDQSPILSCGMGLHWAGPPTWAAVSVKTYCRLAWQKRDKHHT